MNQIKINGIPPLDPLLDALFKENGWHNIKHEDDFVEYTKEGFETEFFRMNVYDQKIYISIPMKHIPFQYKTSFTNHIEAIEFFSKKFKEYIEL